VPPKQNQKSLSKKIKVESPGKVRKQKQDRNRGTNRKANLPFQSLAHLEPMFMVFERGPSQLKLEIYLWASLAFSR
jgi:hypothetical protein